MSDFRCKVVYGCCATGFKDITPPMSYEACVSYLKAHIEQVHCCDEDTDPHYTDSLDIMSVDNGRLMSFML